ncbi:hypothetical protein [Nocardia sp. AG03]|uniref:hypothetical protein n=1 Tax=Nocardia sp. AG03 TaxID=3025312 RepID=UPI00241866C7|nr:hypothetical protein [Nocardia sp. AG03]
MTTPTDDPATPPPATEDEVDVSFTLAPEPVVRDVAEETRKLLHRAARALATQGPQGWRRLDAVFTMTVAAEIVLAVYSDADQRVTRLRPSADVLELIREHRLLSAELGDGPWWRMMLGLSPEGRIQVDYDYGDEPFPADHLFPPAAYRADLEVHPRATVPFWLAAYLAHGDRQLRDPAVAARPQPTTPIPVEGLPPLPQLVARWAVLAAASVAAEDEWGPRFLPSLGRFDTAARHGGALCLLPDDRAVLSGGVWDAPALRSAYLGDTDLPALYAGAPGWVATPTIDRRAAGGLLSFCYWWHDGAWYQGESPPPDEVASALPAVFSAEDTADTLARVVDRTPPPLLRAAAATLVAAAEAGIVTRETLVELFGDEGFFAVDSALFPLDAAGVLLPGIAPMPRRDALALVGTRLTDTAARARLRADRLSTGWLVYLPVEPGDIAVERSLYYVADDGVLEQSSSAVPPSVFLDDFERRFRERND